jgi:hypothetical protein
VSVPNDIHDSIGIIERLRANLATTGAIFAISAGISISMYFLHGYIPILWYEAISTIFFLAAMASGILILYSSGYAGLARLAMCRRLHHLAGDEKTALARFIEKDSMTVAFFGSESGPGSLIQAGIVSIEPNIGELARNEGAFLYTVKSWIFHYLKKHKNLIGLGS